MGMRLSITKVFVITLFAIVFFGCGKKVSEKYDEIKDESISLNIDKREYSNVSIDSTITLELNDDYFKPTFDKSGTKLFATTNGNVGLFLIDLTTTKVDTISTMRGAGIDYCSNVTDVYFIESIYDEKIHTRNYSIKKYNFREGSVSQIAEENSRLYSLKLEDDFLSYFVRDSLRIINVSDGSFVNSKDFRFERYLISKNTIRKMSSNGYEEFRLSTKNNLSNFQMMDDDYLLVEIASEGYYKYSTRDTSKILIGNYTSTNFCRATKLFAYVDSENDGHFTTKSKIGVKHLVNDIKLTISEADYKCENPSWSEDGEKLVFNTFDGKLRIAHLSYN